MFSRPKGYNRLSWILFCLAALAGTVAGQPGTTTAADWPQWRGVNRDGQSPETGLRQTWPAQGLQTLWVATGLGRGYSAVSVAEGSVYVTGMTEQTDEGVLFAFDLAGNRQWRTIYGPEWTNRYPGARSTPTVDSGRLYLLSGMGRLVCCHTRTGAILWSRDVARDFGAELPVCGYAESVVVEGNKVVCTPGGKNACLAALDKTNGRTIWTCKEPAVLG